MRIKTFLMMHALLVFLLTSSIAHSAELPLSKNLDNQEMKAILESRSSRELDTIISSQENLRRWRIECDVQLERKHLPTSCFRVLKKEVETGLIATNKRREQEAWLERLCLRRLKSIRELTEIKSLLDEKSIPNRCREAGTERIADLRYSAESERPSALFKERRLETATRSASEETERGSARFRE